MTDTNLLSGHLSWSWRASSFGPYGSLASAARNQNFDLVCASAWEKALVQLRCSYPCKQNSLCRRQESELCFRAMRIVASSLQTPVYLFYRSNVSESFGLLCAAKFSLTVIVAICEGLSKCSVYYHNINKRKNLFYFIVIKASHVFTIQIHTFLLVLFNPPKGLYCISSRISWKTTVWPLEWLQLYH